MDNKKVLTISKNENDAGGGYKVIEMNVSDPAANIYAVCTPVKTQ